MENTLFKRFASTFCQYDGNPKSPQLLLASEGPLSCFYAPFDWVNPAARVVLVGITPGQTQADNALREAGAQLARGSSDAVALLAAKRTGAFSGAMRPNLVAMLNHVGLRSWLGLSSCDALFGAYADLLQTSSVLPFPVFVNGENYNGTPDIAKSGLLRSLVLEHFVPVLKALPNAVFVPLGPVPTKVLDWLAGEGHVRAEQVLAGLPHPSGANAERIAYFLGTKPKHALSAKTDPIKLDQARAHLVAAVARLPAA